MPNNQLKLFNSELVIEQFWLRPKLNCDDWTKCILFILEAHFIQKIFLELVEFLTSAVA